MKARFLFPHQLRYLGYILAVPGFILGFFVLYFNYKIPGFELKIRSHDDLLLPAIENFTNELALALVIVGLLFIAFSKVKREDELTARIRLNSLYWAILVNSTTVVCLLLATTVASALNLQLPGFFNSADNSFLVYNFFVPLLIFIGRFYYLVNNNKNEFTLTKLPFLPNKPWRLLAVFPSLILIVFVITSLPLKSDLPVVAWVSLSLTLLLWVYTKEKAEDEYINVIRLESMQIAVYVNYSILLISNLFVYGIDFLTVQMLNLITIPVIFIAWFQYRLHSTNKPASVKTMLI